MHQFITYSMVVFFDQKNERNLGGKSIFENFDFWVVSTFKFGLILFVCLFLTRYSLGDL